MVSTQPAAAIFEKDRETEALLPILLFVAPDSRRRIDELSFLIGFKGEL